MGVLQAWPWRAGEEKAVRMPVRLRWVVGWVFLLGVWLGGHTESAAEGGKYVGEGVGVILQGDQAAARDRALQEALRDALENAVVDLFGADRVAGRRAGSKSRLYTRPWQYVRSFRVLWEYPDIPQKVYRASVEAEISPNDVRRAFEAPSTSRSRETRENPGQRGAREESRAREAREDSRARLAPRTMSVTPAGEGVN